MEHKTQPKKRAPTRSVEWSYLLASPLKFVIIVSKSGKKNFSAKNAVGGSTSMVKQKWCQIYFGKALRMMSMCYRIANLYTWIFAATAVAARLANRG